MISELPKNSNGRVNFFQFAKMVGERKHKKTDETSDILDAFVAMGGDDDGGGSIDADKLIEIIKEDLKMTINMVIF